MHTTLTLLKKNHACTDRYRHLCKSLGGAKKYGYNTPIQFPDLLAMNGLDDTLWALRAVPKEQEPERDFIARLFACSCAEHVLPIYEGRYPTDKRVRLCIEASRKFAYGEITDTELAAAQEAARYDADAWAADARAAAWAVAADAADAACAAAWAADAWAASAAAAAAAAAGVAAAARIAAARAARAAEIDWQAAELLKLLGAGEEI